MFDKTVLCTQGDQLNFGNTGSSLHQLLRSKQVTLTEGSVKVCFLTGDKPDPSDLRKLIAVVNPGDGSIAISSNSTWSTDNYNLVILNCKFSMLSELHVVAWGDEFKGGGGSAQAPTGYCVVVIVSGCAFIAALSDEPLTCNEKLKMTFDIEETNGVLQAKADFDGTITQGIFDKLHDYETLINKPQIQSVGDGKVTMTVLTGAVELKTEPDGDGDGGTQTSVEPSNSAIVSQEFTVNQSGASSLYLGAAALKGVDTSITGDGSLSNVPTSSAVASYVKDTPVRVFVNKNRQTISDPDGGATTVNPTGTFTLNEALASGVEYIDIDLGLGTAAGAYVVTLSSDGGSTETINTVAGQDNHLITLEQAKSLVQAGVGNGTITVLAGATQENDAGGGITYTGGESVGTFTVNQSGNTTLNLGAAAKRAVDSSIDPESSSNNLPTTDAVISYVTNRGYLTLGDLPPVNNNTITIRKNSSDIYNPISFTLNQNSDATFDLDLGDAALKAVDSSLSDGTTQNGVPSSEAVKNYISRKNYITSSAIGTANLNIFKGSSSVGTPDFTFNANQSINDGNVDVILGLGSVAAKDVETTLSPSSDACVPTSQAVATYISGLGYATTSQLPTVGNGELQIKKHTDDTSPISTGFYANSDSAVTVDLALGAAADKDVDSTIVVTGSSPSLTAGDNLPTSEAVRSFVEGKGYITSTSVSDAQISIAHHLASDTSQSANFGTFTLNGSASTVTLGSASACEVVYLSGSDTIDTVTGQDTRLVTLGQAKTLAQNATAPKTATVTTSDGSTSVDIPVGSLVWLAINFIGSVNITSFTTQALETTSAWGGGEAENARTAATYIAKLNDHNGDFFKSDVQVPAGYKFRTLNAMEVTGESMPCYGYALCMCIEAPSAG